MKVAIVGAGPAGLSLAKLLQDTHRIRPVIFEAGSKPGGKSLTVTPGTEPVEMGTCYLTASHKRVLRWMSDCDIDLKPVGEQLFDGGDVIRYIRKGEGAPMPVQVVKYLKLRKALLDHLREPSPRQNVLDHAARPAREWLERNGLGKMVRLMQRAMTGLGYGRLERVPTLHALRWVDRELIVSGMRKQLKMPVEGWTEFWLRLSRDMDLKCNHRVKAVQRLSSGVEIETSGGSEKFDFVVCAIPMDEFVSLLDHPSEQETDIRNSILWGRYATTLVAVTGWFTDHPIEIWSEAIQPGAPAGLPVSARYEGFEPELGGHLYVTGQYVDGLNAAEQAEVLQAEISRRGAIVENVIMPMTWKYMATYAPHAIRKGLLAKMAAVQGNSSTFYTGTAFSHEAVSHIVEFNAARAKSIAAGCSRPALDWPLAAE